MACRPELLATVPADPRSRAAALTEAFDLRVRRASTAGTVRRLTLRSFDEEIVRAVAAEPADRGGLVAAGAVITESWRHQVPAVLMLWYAGMEGGHALADVLTGAHNPTGRLPFSIPTSAEHLPSFDRDATAVTYDRFHGSGSSTGSACRRRSRTASACPTRRSPVPQFAQPLDADRRPRL